MNRALENQPELLAKLNKGFSELFSFKYLSLGKLESLIEKEEVEEDLECPGCLCPIETDQNIEVVQSNIASIKQICIEFLENHDDPDNLKKIRQLIWKDTSIQENEDTKVEVLHKQCFKILSEEFNQSINRQRADEEMSTIQSQM